LSLQDDISSQEKEYSDKELFQKLKKKVAKVRNRTPLPMPDIKKIIEETADEKQ
jgi:hypothetical protein